MPKFNRMPNRKFATTATTSSGIGNPAAVQAIFPMAVLLIFLTTAYQTQDQIESGVLRAIIDANPTEYVLRAMRDLMLDGYNWSAIGLAFAVIVGLGALGVPLTVRNYRSVYR